MPPIATADFVGLDVHKAIVDNVYANTKDYARSTFILPEYMQKLIDEGVNIHEADVEALAEACKDVPNKFTWGSTYYPQMLELLGK